MSQSPARTPSPSDTPARRRRVLWKAIATALCLTLVVGALALWWATSHIDRDGRLPTPAMAFCVPGGFLQATGMQDGLHCICMRDHLSRGFSIQFDRATYRAMEVTTAERSLRLAGSPWRYSPKHSTIPTGSFRPMRRSLCPIGSWSRCLDPRSYTSPASFRLFFPCVLAGPGFTRKSRAALSREATIGFANTAPRGQAPVVATWLHWACPSGLTPDGYTKPDFLRRITSITSPPETAR